MTAPARDCEGPPRRGFVEMHGNRHQRGEADVDGEEPQRLADAQAGLDEEVGRNSELAGHGQPDPGDDDEDRGGYGEAAQSGTQIVGPGSASGTGAPPSGDARVSADDEEQGHDLEEPGRCGESGGRRQRDRRSHSAFGSEHRRAHHRVEDDHDDEAAEAEEGRWPGRGGVRRRFGVRESERALRSGCVRPASSGVRPTSVIDRAGQRVVEHVSVISVPCQSRSVSESFSADHVRPDAIDTEVRNRICPSAHHAGEPTSPPPTDTSEGYRSTGHLILAVTRIV
jgi:hypothetical protein